MLMRYVLKFPWDTYLAIFSESFSTADILTWTRTINTGVSKDNNYVAEIVSWAWLPWSAKAIAVFNLRNFGIGLDQCAKVDLFSCIGMQI